MISSSDIISRSFSLYKENFLDYVKYIILNLLPGMIGVGLFFVFGTTAALGATAFDVTSVASLGFGVFLLVAAMLLIIGIAFWINIAFLRMIGVKDRGDDTESVLDNFLEVRSKFWRAIGTSIVMAIYAGWPTLVVAALVALLNVIGVNVSGGVAIFMTLLGIAAILLGLYFSVRVFFAVFHVILEDADIFEAIDFSQNKVIGNWFGVFWRLIAPAVVFFVVTILVQIVLGGLSAVVDSLAISAIFSIALFVFQLLIPPLYPTAQVVLYNDLSDSSLATSSDPGDQDQSESSSQSNEGEVDLENSLDS
ncbi:MAG: hypothetical protein ABEJ02_03475 [Candidatus Paceibacteria bacterium]